MTVDLDALMQLPCEEQLEIAKALAHNVGYQLIPEGKASAADVDWAIERWNDMAKVTEQGNDAHKLARVRKLNPANRKALATRLGEFGRDGWETCLVAVFRSAHCRGVNDRGWKADITYLLQAKGSNKAVNGGWPADYEERTRGGQRTGVGGRGNERLDGLRSFDRAIRGGLAQGGQHGGGVPEGGEGSGDDGGRPRRAQHRLAFVPGGDV